MPSPVKVIGRDGALALRKDGIFLDGDTLCEGQVADGQSVTVPMMLRDSATIPDQAARHAMVRDRLGDAAVGKSDAYLDGAWKALQPGYVATPTTTPAAVAAAISDTQRDLAQQGIKQALADHAARNPFALTDADQGHRDSSRASATARLTDAWKGSTQRTADAIFDGASYAERQAIKSGSRASMVKASDRSLSDAEFYRRQRAFNANRDTAA